MKASSKSNNLTPLPDGTDISAYEGFETWHYRRWAWEFLRRNDDFREACSGLKKLHGDDRDLRKREIAKEFMLRNFRHCDRKVRDQDRIAFLAQKISPFSPSVTEWGASLENYEVAIVFDLRPSLYAKNAIKSQLENTRKTLLKRLAEFKTLIAFENKSAAATVKEDVYLHRLRVLDARRAKLTWEQIAECLQTDADRLIDIKDRTERLRKDHKEAMKFVKFGYLRILT
ncbi:MAG: hypothetical protein P4L81_03750 [Candidatus Pacebacteria bacterium]|nr:hypothetical protein [Candidatus Paceibacterota bacterium]